jgi:hypothetical protein
MNFIYSVFLRYLISLMMLVKCKNNEFVKQFPLVFLYVTLKLTNPKKA